MKIKVCDIQKFDRDAVEWQRRFNTVKRIGVEAAQVATALVAAFVLIYLQNLDLQAAAGGVIRI